ncbi:hypothetical protein PHET_06106 [Paragonimus heterotremus]|uniref:Uncharacterized protein n=1 Tax=Paragonimus heterotremus TaxID=100268 RepID=A0A8J4WQZ1_9TREM|nr:hypothetical protein PHET_06106 [Paragonimus heterotremus]
MKTFSVIISLSILAAMTMNCLGATIKTTVRMAKSPQNGICSYENEPEVPKARGLPVKSYSGYLKPSSPMMDKAGHYELLA